ncbi:hypothetical protein FRC03_004747, partial [Tulasnella sp. 419]
MAGTGKTTISRTVAKRFDDSDYLGASFFFSRDEDDRRTANLVFPTIAYQLARRNPSLREHIVKAANPDVCTAMMRTQLNKLIVEPLKRSNPQSFPLVIVMDALDECVKESQITEMLVLLAPVVQVIRNTINIKFFLTSRPEVHLSSEFREPGMEAVSRISVLHDIEKSLVRADISRYVEYHLRRIAKSILPQHTIWPTSEEKEALIDMTDGLFIFAAVTVAYIGDTKHRKPKQRLRNILSPSKSDQTTVSLKHLDNLYRQILVASLPESNEDDEFQEITHQIRQILGTVVLLLYPVSSRVLEKLLQWEEDTVEPALGPFHSVLAIPSDPIPIRVFHKSFPDFLTDKRRSGDHWFHIDPSEHHTRLALLCLTHMTNLLHRDMCGVGNKLVSQLDDVESILQSKVQGHVLYACRHWVAHLKEAVWTDELGAALKNFCVNKLLCWLEILCLDKKLSLAILALDFARQWARELHSSPRLVMTDDHDTWDRGLFILTAHSSLVKAVACSPDGVLLASGSDDEKVIIWDSRTGAQVHSLEGHSGRVLAVVFSPDGSLIASGSEDKSVRIWNTAVGIVVHILNGHSDWVRSVSFSPRGDVVASGSDDGTVILWDSGSGSPNRIFNGPPCWVSSVTFLPEGTQIVSCAIDSTITIWDTQTGTLLWSFKGIKSGARFDAAAFSSDGTKLAYISEDGISLWDYRSRNMMRELTARIDYGVYCVTFSPDNRFIVTGLKTGQIAAWHVISGTQIGIVSGHAKPVASVAISPDGTRIFSGSHDHTAALWDMRSGWESRDGNNHSDRNVHADAVRRVAFSLDGNMLASVAEDNIVALWDIRSHALIRTLNGHKQTVTAVAFSNDGRYIASGSNDETIMVWDVGIDKPIKILEVDGWVEYLEFFLDGLYLVAAFQSMESGRGSMVPKLGISWSRWCTRNFGECEQLSLTREQAQKLLIGSRSSKGAPPSGTYLARDKDS